MTFYMGKKYAFKCNKCGFKAQASGKHDFRMHTVTDVYICTSCQIIVGVNAEEEGKAETEEVVLMEDEPDLDFWICPECGGDANLVKWNENKHPCPECDGEMRR